MIIDLEQHIHTEEHLRKRGAKPGKIQRSWDANGKLRIYPSQEGSRIERHLQVMDETGIDMTVLSGNIRSNLDDCRHWNEFCADVVKKYPKRFAGFAAVMPLGGKPAFEEMKRAIKELGMKGVHISAQVEGHNLDSRELWPFYEKVSELGVPINVHIASEPSGLDVLQAPYGLYYVMARELHMCAATLRVCLGGVLEDFPDLVLIMNHFGGGVSALKERLDVYMSYEGNDFSGFYMDKPLISKPWTEYFDKLYFSIAGREIGMDSLKCALTNISPRKLMFATDWPFNFEANPAGIKRYIGEIMKLDLSQSEIAGILGGNAANLLGI